MSPFKRRCLAIKLGYDSIASAAAALHDRPMHRNVIYIRRKLAQIV